MVGNVCYVGSLNTEVCCEKVIKNFHQTFRLKSNAVVNVPEFLRFLHTQPHVTSHNVNIFTSQSLNLLPKHFHKNNFLSHLTM